jgi:hypothetical protein
MHRHIDWNLHLATREATVLRAQLLRVVTTHLSENDQFATTSWWRAANKKSFRDLKNGGLMAVNLIGDYLPDDH